MISFSGVSLGRALSDISFDFDGASLCVISDSKAIADLICGACAKTSGTVVNDFGRIPLITSSLPRELTVKELLDVICGVGNAPLSAYSYELTHEIFDKVIKTLTSSEKATVAIAALFASESNAVFAEALTDGLLKNEREEIISLLLSSGEETETAVIYTTDSASEMEKSEYVLVIEDGKTLFFGNTEDFVKKATEPSPITARVMGERDKAESLFEKFGATADNDIKKNVFKATLPPDTDISNFKKLAKAAKLSVLDTRMENEKLSKTYSSLKDTDEKLDEQYEDYKQEHAAPRKLELSDFAFNRDDEEEDDQ